MDFHAASAIVAPPEGSRRDLDGWIAEHRSDALERFCLTRDELTQDLQDLTALALALHQAGQVVASAVDRLARNNISLDAPAPTVRELAARFDEALDGLLSASAARVVSAALDEIG